jgi:lipopolysaccharide biosynthesis glycosyltransferase
MSDLIMPWMSSESSAFASHAQSSFNAKLIKCRLLDILPSSVQKPLYIDSDIIVGHSLESFWKNLDRIWRRNDNAVDDVDSPVAMAMLEDGKAFTAGFCTDCDTWNTGVMSLQRGQSESCLNAWCETLALTGGTDQAALDKVLLLAKSNVKISLPSTRDNTRV